MTTCHNIREKLIFYIENEIAEDSRSNIENHLMQCAECQSYKIFLEKEFEKVKGYRMVQASPFLYTKIQAKLENYKPISTSNKWIQVALISAVIIVSVFSGIGIASAFWSKYQSVGTESSYSLNSYTTESVEYALLDSEETK